MKNNSICIIAIGYNRPYAMERLLFSLKNSNYQDQKVDLLISIDRGEKQKEIIRIAESFEWPYGEKKIRSYSKRQGLRSHVLQCGDVTNEYEAVIVLEDDIEVSNCYFLYVQECIKKYSTNPQIAGISLYKHVTNVCGNHFFEPDNDEYDVYFMQYAQSWGQCWTKSMWEKFKRWYIENENNQLNNSLPSNVLSWGKHSWLKYYINYVVVNDLFFVYPRISHSTNNSDVGQHCNKANSSFQLPLARNKFIYNLPDFENAIKYDVFFERMEFKIPNFENKKIIIDLYGNKTKYENGDILISTSSKSYRLITSWQLKYRPHEINLIRQIEGRDIFVYDLSTKSDSKPKVNKHLRTEYDTKFISWKELLLLGLLNFRNALIKKVFKRYFF